MVSSWCRQHRIVTVSSSSHCRGVVVVALLQCHHCRVVMVLSLSRCRGVVVITLLPCRLQHRVMAVSSWPSHCCLHRRIFAVSSLCKAPESLRLDLSNSGKCRRCPRVPVTERQG